MTIPAGAFQPAIDALEEDYTDLERQANALLTSINILRAKAGLPPRPSGFGPAAAEGTRRSHSGHMPIQSDTFTGKKLGSAVRQFLEMRKAGGGDAPATTREIFDALKEGGFVSGAKDEATGMVVLRTMLRKNTTMFVKLHNGKIGLRAWYPGLKVPKENASGKATEEDAEAETDAEADAESDAEADEEAEARAANEPAA
jgi:hypothetical protein